MTEDPKELVALLPCPFCGNTRPQCVWSGDGDYVECGSCLATMPPHDDDVPDEVARWNTRLTADRERSVPEDEVERVARAAMERALAVMGEVKQHHRDCEWSANGKFWLGVARAAIAATPPRIPEGFVLVPVVPTEAMISQAVYGNDLQATGASRSTVLDAWQAMIAAAPAPALPETGVE